MMDERMYDELVEGLGALVAAEPGRVTWLASVPGTGKSRVLAAFVRQRSAEGVKAFVYDQGLAYGYDELPGDAIVLLGGARGLMEGGDSYVAEAVAAGVGLVVLSAFSLLVPAGTDPERFYYESSGSLRGLAAEKGIAVVLAVQEPRQGWSPPAAAFSFLGEGFEGDRMLRLTSEGAMEVLRP